MSPYAPDLFAGAAPYYARFRVPYPPEAIDFVADSFGLDRRSRVLDLGCGPGTLAILLAARAGEILAMDPDLGMLAAGKSRAEETAVRNIRWRQGGSEDLAEIPGPFRLAVMGQSFHWMDRDQVLRDLDRLLEVGGGVALVAPGPRRPQESWESVAEAVVESFLGKPPPHPRRAAEPRHEPAIARSAFEIARRREFPAFIERDIASITGALYSMSGSTPRLFGDARPEFEAQLRGDLLELKPDGLFGENVETEVVVLRRRQGAYSQ